MKEIIKVCRVVEFSSNVALVTRANDTDGYSHGH